MTRLVLLIIAMLVTAVAPARAQSKSSPEEGEILAVIDSFMHAISTNDDKALAALRLDGTLTTVASPAADGSTRITRRGPSVDGISPGMRERYWDPTVLVRRSIAIVWAPYEFWRDGKTTHCGVDVFDLVKEAGAWRIAHVMYTVEADACPELRPADPSRIRPKQ